MIHFQAIYTNTHGVVYALTWDWLEIKISIDILSKQPQPEKKSREEKFLLMQKI